MPIEHVLQIRRGDSHTVVLDAESNGVAVE
jgi:hypothetical protein